MSEIIFLVEESKDGGYEARALGTSILTRPRRWRRSRTQYGMPSAVTSPRRTAYASLGIQLAGRAFGGVPLRADRRKNASCLEVVPPAGFEPALPA